MHNTQRIWTLTLALSLAMSAQARAQDGLRVVVAGKELPSTRVRSVVVDSDVSSADSATIRIEVPRTPSISPGDEIVVVATGGTAADQAIFKGEVVGIEPIFGEGGAVLVRSFDRSHRLNRGTKTRTFERQSDADIAATIAGEAGLVVGPTGPEAVIVHERVVQYNQTDLDFLRMRADRIGYTVKVDGETLFFHRQPDALPLPLGCGSDRSGLTELRLFHPRLSPATVVKKVTVRGWDPVKKEEIDAEATRRMIPLSSGGAKIVEPPGPSLDLGLVVPLETVQSAYGAANGTLMAVTALDLSAEADADGNASIHARVKVIIQGTGSRFDGKYKVTGASHRFDRDAENRWHTLLRLVREDRAVFLLPEIGNGMLVSFEHGDMNRPYIVGSLWNSIEPVAETPFCSRLEKE